MKLTEALSFEGQNIAEMVMKLPEGVTLKDYLQSTQQKMIEEMSPKLKDYLASLNLNQVYAAMTTQKEVEEYKVEHLSVGFKKELAEFVDNMNLTAFEAMFIYDTFLEMYHHSAVEQTTSIARARLKNILNQPKSALL